MKILILKPSSLGDVVQALPVLRLLKRHFPGAEIYWWIEGSFAALLENDPDLAGIYRFHRQRWKKPWYWPEFYASIRAMREQRFDWVIDLQSLMRSGLVAWLVNGGLTIGLDDPREGARGFYDIIVSRPSYDTHAADWYLQVLREVKVPVAPEFTWLPPYPKAAAAVRQMWPAPKTRWLALQPGARWSNKRWPAENYAELVRLLSLQEPSLHFAILGSAAERDLGKLVAQALPERCLDLTGSTSLPEMVEWIRGSELMVTNDTGPMHIAAALGKPVLALFGPTDPRRTGPYGQNQNVLTTPLPCAPCMKSRCHYEKPMECLRAITPGLVCAQILRRLSPP